MRDPARRARPAAGRAARRLRDRHPDRRPAARLLGRGALDRDALPRDPALRPALPRQVRRADAAADARPDRRSPTSPRWCFCWSAPTSSSARSTRATGASRSSPGSSSGFAFCVKPSNVIFFCAAGLAFLVARRWRQTDSSSARRSCPGCCWSCSGSSAGWARGPLFAGRQRRRAGGARLPLPGGTLAAPGRYVNVDWNHLRQNRDALREFFWAIRPLEWVLIAGVLAIGRRSWPKAGLVAVWLARFLVVKGTSDQASVEDASFFRLLMPSFPAFLFLLAVGAAAGAEARRSDRHPLPGRDDRHPAAAQPADRRRRGAVRPRADDRPRRHPRPGRADDGEERRRAHEHPGQRWPAAVRAPVGRARCSSELDGALQRAAWTSSTRCSARARHIPDPSNPEERTVDGRRLLPAAAEPRGAGLPSVHAADRVGAGRRAYVDRPPPGRWTYRVAIGANWRRRPGGRRPAAHQRAGDVVRARRVRARATAARAARAAAPAPCSGRSAWRSPSSSRAARAG